MSEFFSIANELAEKTKIPAIVDPKEWETYVIADINKTIAEIAMIQYTIDQWMGDVETSRALLEERKKRYKDSRIL
jgi:hypothetical protein